MKNYMELQKYIYGCGGHGKVVYESCGDSQIIFIDDIACKAHGGRPVIRLTHVNPRGGLVHCAIGDGVLRQSILASCRKVGLAPWSIISRFSVVSTEASLGGGCFVGTSCTISPGVLIGSGVLINTGAIVDHDTVIGDYCTIDPGAIICGGVTLGKHVLVGPGATICKGVELGDGCVVGAGSVVLGGSCRPKSRLFGVIKGCKP